MHIKQKHSSYEQRAELQLKIHGECVKTVNTEGCCLVRNPFIGKNLEVEITAIMARKCKMNGCLKEIVMTLPIFCSKQWLRRTVPGINAASQMKRGTLNQLVDKNKHNSSVATLGLLCRVNILPHAV